MSSGCASTSPPRRSPARCSSIRTTSSTTPASRSSPPSGRSRSRSRPRVSRRCSCRGSRWSTRAARPASSASPTTTSTRAIRVRRRRSPTCSLPCAIAGQIGADQDGYPWILGYQGPSLSELTSGEVVRVVAVRRGADGREVGGRARAHPRELEVGEPRAPAPAAVHAARPHRDGGDATRVGRGDDGDASDARAALPRPEPVHTAARTPAIAARSAAARRSRTRSRTTSSSRRATCS